VTHPAQEDRVEGRSSVKITRNAKGEPQVEVKVYDDDADAASAKALELYDRTLLRLGLVSPVIFPRESEL
jgi:hypothetical protein